MLIYKQRYKPRATREFTKSDLTVYDSAGNTALNALTVYGKSEVVDNAIVSAGEGWATVDLGTWNWYLTNDGRIYAPAKYDIKKPASSNDVANVVCAIFKADTDENTRNHVTNKTIAVGGDNAVYVYDTDYTDAEAFKTAMNGVILAYKEATPTNNTIAIKTDDGSGINGTMATFSTGTPLRGIPDSNVRDVMAWDGSAGTVTEVCGEVDLGTATYTYDSNNKWFSTTAFASTIKPTSDTQQANILSSIYTSNTVAQMLSDQTINMACATNRFGTLIIRNTDYTDSATFKTAMNGVKLVYELATPTTEQLTSTENASLAGLRTFQPQTHAQNNAQTKMAVDYTIRVPTI